MILFAAIAPYVGIGASSCLGQLYHAARGLNKPYHKVAFDYYGVRGYNAFYRFIGSQERLHCCFPPVDFEKLVATRNVAPLEFLDANGVETLMTMTARMVKTLKIPPYIQLTPTTTAAVLENLNKGVCFGMSVLFIRDYFANRNRTLPVEQAALDAAKPYADGGTAEACWWQYCHKIVAVQDKEFDEQFASLSPREQQLIKGSCSHSFAPISLGATEVSLDWINSLPFPSLNDGVYYLSEAFYLNAGTLAGHGTVLIVEKGYSLLFDPNMGLLRLQEPESYLSLKIEDDCFSAFCFLKISYATPAQNL